MDSSTRPEKKIPAKGGESGYHDILFGRAGEYLEALRQRGIPGELDVDSLREYSVALKVNQPVGKPGRVTIYYKPTAKKFSRRLSGFTDKRIEAEIAQSLAGAEGASPAPAVVTEPELQAGVHAFVDGSHIDGRTGYGAIIIRDGRVVAELSGPVSANESGGSRQVAGEIAAVMKVVDWCRDNGVAEITIHYDYRGLSRWVTGEYRSNLPLTRAYRDHVRESGLAIRWVKIKSHSGNRWNDAADRLARRGAGDGGGQSRNAGGGPSGRASAAAARARDFAAFLRARKMEAEFVGLYNDQYARVRVGCRGGGRPGFFDLYNTPRKPFSPYLHGFAGEPCRETVAGLWQEFSSGGKKKKAGAGSGASNA